MNGLILKMEKIFIILVLCVVVKAVHKHHPKFPKVSEDGYEVPLLKKGRFP